MADTRCARSDADSLTFSLQGDTAESCVAPADERRSPESADVATRHAAYRQHQLCLPVILIGLVVIAFPGGIDAASGAVEFRRFIGTGATIGNLSVFSCESLPDVMPSRGAPCLYVGVRNVSVISCCPHARTCCMHEGRHRIFQVRTSRACHARRFRWVVQDARGASDAIPKRKWWRIIASLRWGVWVRGGGNAESRRMLKGSKVRVM
jgi:hypothetical protein